MKPLVIVEHVNDKEKYEEELKNLGWCLECQGYGQDWDDGSACKNCNGTGKYTYEDLA